MVNTSVDYYINGVLIVTNPLGAMFPTTGIASLFIGSQYSSRFYQGDIDDIKIFSSPLDSTMVADLYNEPNPTASTENMEESNFSIYPNPATTSINIETEEKINDVLIFNVSGELIMNSELNDNSLDISELPSGVYIIHLSTEEGLHRSRFIKK